MKTAAGLVAAALLVAAPVLARTSCPAGLHSARSAELFFGQAVGGRVLSDSEWAAFLDSEVTPRFPDGLTVWKAEGQWRPPGGALGREPTRVMLIELTGANNERARLDGVIDAYKSRYHQKSVLLVEHGDCIRF
jgi:broad specificity phosphatase PhoE